MASRIIFGLCSFLLVLFPFSVLASSALSPYYYNTVCPNALPTIKQVVLAAVNKEQRMGASLLRLHFHDCFVQGCDGSVLLDNSSTIVSEKSAIPNANSLRGFDVVDQIKSEVDKACGGPVVSCADILAVAARDSVVALGGPYWDVLLGRKDSTTANIALANVNIPSPFMDLPALVQNFQNQGLGIGDLVTLSGAHTLGFAQCRTFKNRIYNDTNINANFATQLKSICPVNGGDFNLAPLDPTPARFNLGYFTNLVSDKGLLHSDQALFNGGSTDALVKAYSTNYGAFSSNFVSSMIKMGNISPLTGSQGQVRLNCRVVNQS